MENLKALRIKKVKSFLKIKEGDMSFYPKEHKKILDEKLFEYNKKFKEDFSIQYSEVEVQDGKITKIEYNIIKINDNISEERLEFLTRILKNKKLEKTGKIKSLLKKIIRFTGKPLKKRELVEQRTKFIDFFNKRYNSDFYIERVQCPNGSSKLEIRGDNNGPELDFG